MSEAASTWKGGARIGRSYWLSINASTPLATLVVSRNSVQLKCLGRAYTFARADMERVTVYSGIFSEGIQIEHTNARCPKLIVFWTFQLEELQADLQRLGFRLS